MILYFDTETTGLYPGNICQLSYVMHDRAGVRAKNFFFKVDYVESGAFAVHGLSVPLLQKLSNGMDFSCRIDEIEKDFSNADIVVAHNISFDNTFMRTEFERLGRIYCPKAEFCSMKKMTPVCMLPKSRGFGYKYPKLNELCAYFGIDEFEAKETTKDLFGTDSTFHDARFDTTCVYLAMKAGIGRIDALNELEETL